MTPYASDSEPHAALVALQNELGRYVVEEHAIQRETMHRRWASPLEDRLIEGRCIAELKVVAQPSPKRWVLECEGNDSRFREGDFVRLSRGDPKFPFMEASLLVVGDNKIELLEWRAYGDQSCTVGQSGICIDESFIDLEDRYRGAIEDLGKTDVGRELILPLLRGALKPQLDATEFNDAADRGRSRIA